MMTFSRNVTDLKSSKHLSPMNAYSEEERSLFLGDLSCFCDECHIYQLFASCGAIEGVRLMRSKATNRCLGYGFITFRDINSFLSAVKFHGKLFMGRKINNQNTKLLVAQVHYSYLTHNVQSLITEETLLSLFSQFGEVDDVTIKKSSIDPRTRTQSGYGFIHYPLTDAGIHAAIRATSVLRQLMVGEVLYDSCLTRSVEEMVYFKDRVLVSTKGSSCNPHRDACHYPPMRYEHDLTTWRPTSRPVEPVFTTYGTSSPTISDSLSEHDAGFEEMKYFDHSFSGETILEGLGLFKSPTILQSLHFA